MPLRSWKIAALGALVILPVLAGGLDESDQKGTGMATWKTSVAWRKYKAHWKEVPKLASVKQVETAWDASRELRLDLLFPNNPELVSDLNASLGDRLKGRLRRLQTPRGRLPKPDWKERVAETIERVEHRAGAVRGLRAVEVQDSWVEETLVPDLDQHCQALESEVKSLERGLPQDPETALLVAKARAAVESARALLTGQTSKQ
jgi:hypothetical protein